MKAGVLPREERAAAQATGVVWMPLVADRDRDVVAVKDDAGKIIACMSMVRTIHYEGVYVDPGHRNGGAVRALLRAASEHARDEYGVEWVFVDALDPEIASFVARLGGAPIPGVTCYMPLMEEG